MSDKTENQLVINEKLTSLLNSNELITDFNIFVIDLLQKNLAEIEWGKEFDSLQPYWFFVKGGTALRLILEKSKNDQVMPNPSDWDTQIVINPEFSFDVWYEAYEKIEKVVNETIVMANMVFTILPDVEPLIQELFPHECNSLDIITEEWNGEVKYRNSADRKTVYEYEMFHPLQPADTARRRFAHLTPEQWDDSGTARSLFDEMFPRETVEFNQLQYRTLILWSKAYHAFNEFLITTGLSEVLSTDQMSKLEENYEFYKWSMMRVTDNVKEKAIKWLASNGIELEPTTPVDTVQQRLKGFYKNSAKKTVLLASGQRTLIIDEFYLYRLVVRYKYHKPTPLAENKTIPEYIDAWTASGNLRGELIDVTIPRRDTYEARHHGVMLSQKIWQVQEINKPLSDKIGAQPVSLPVLSDNYQVSEQVLIVREILVGESSSPTKIGKRLKRGFVLASPGNAVDARDHARTNLIEIMQQQFESTYMPLANQEVNQKISDCVRFLKAWSDGTIKTKDEAKLDAIFTEQMSRSETVLEETGLSEGKLKDLATFTNDVADTAAYPNIWGEDEINAGMIDFFTIVTVFAGLAYLLQQELQGRKLNLSIQRNRGATGAREIIKRFCRYFSDHTQLYPQVAGKAASFYHLKELDEVFGNVHDKISVSTIDIKAIYFYKADISEVKHKIGPLTKTIHDALSGIGAFLLQNKVILGYEVNRTDILTFSLDVQIQTDKGSIRQTYLRVELDTRSWWNFAEYTTEYAYGIPVIGLSELISNLQYQVGASEFSEGQRVRAELKALQQALSIREFARFNRDSVRPPPPKRTLSHSNLLDLM